MARAPRDLIPEALRGPLGTVVRILPVALLMILVVWLTSPYSVPPDIDHIEGTWAGVDLATGREVALTVPGNFALQGLGGDAHVELRVPVALGHEPSALLIDQVGHDAVVRLDGERIGGTPGLAGGNQRLLVAIPPVGPGEHELTIEVIGHYGRGGIYGRALTGSFETLVAVGEHDSAVSLGFAVGVLVLGLANLTVGLSGATRRASLTYGMFTASVGLWAFARFPGATEMLGSGLLQVRMTRFGEPLMCATAVPFVSAFIGVERSRIDRAWLAIGAVLIAGAVLLPANLMGPLESIQDLFAVASVFAVATILRSGIARNIPGSQWLLASVIPLGWGIVIEMGRTWGLVAIGSQLVPSLVLFFAASGAATALQHAEEAERHRKLVRGSVDPIVAVTPDGMITLKNPAAEALLGSVARENLLASVAVDDQPIARAHILRAVTSADRAEFRLRIGSREVVVESHATPFEAEVALLMLRDVTRRRQIERGVLHAARMETVATLVGGIAHDFNNMLGALLAQIGLLQTTTGEMATKARLDRMESTVERASLLTRRLLTVAGGTAANLEPIAIGAICEEAIELARPAMSGQITIDADIPDGLPLALGSASDLEQVIVNLLLNARDAIGTSGRIRLVARFFGRDQIQGLAVMVEDNGPGVPADLRERIFEPFFTTKGARGSGLGLAMAAQILRDHHGRIWLEDRPGGGTRMCMAIRLADAVDEQSGRLPDGRRVLLVEDERDLLESYAKALRDAGYDVLACASGSEASQSLSTERPDVLVTDVVMPQVTGLDLAGLCRRLYPDVPVLLVSGFIPEPNIGGLADGSWFRLDKPVRTARLVATVGRLGRRAERQKRDEGDITEVNYLFPPFDALTWSQIDP